MNDRKTWLITGCSSGLGKCLATEALQQGRNVILTARNPDSLKELADLFPERSVVARLDVTEQETIDSAIAKGLERFGQIDVLVNNAGYALRGAAEECGLDEVEREFDVNFYGPVRTIQAILPHMRNARNGMIVNYSSIAALCPRGGSAYYSAVKRALEGFSDTLRLEVEPLGVKVMVVEPGSFHTDFFYRSIEICERNIEDYAATAHDRKVRLKDPENYGTGFGDPRKAAKVVIRAVDEKNPPNYLLLGSNAVQRAESALKKRLKEVDAWKHMSVGSDKD